MSNIVIQTTFSNEKAASKLAERLIEKKLAACIQIEGPILSLYSWKNKVVKEQEYRCQIKTTAKKYQEIESYILKNHNYENPEIISFKINNGSPRYLEWMKGVLE